MITASGLTKAYGSRTLFADVAIRVSAGRRIALVGGNGIGKTTLLEILVGLQDADSGSVHRPKDMRIGYLPQDLTEDWNGTVLDTVVAGADHIVALADRLGDLEARIATTTGAEHDKVLQQYGEAQSRFQTLGGYALESEAHRVLAGLGFAPDDSFRLVSEMSGGWRMRVALARLLLSNPEVLILDEPTNHLDIDSVDWLEHHLADWPGALLFVSHDRDFIDEVANRVIEVSNAQAIEYVGGFAEFVVAREERIAQLEAAAAQQARKVAHLEQFVDRFRYKATKARQVQSRLKTLEKLEAIAVPTRKQLITKFGFPQPRRSSRVVVEMVDVTVSYDDDPPVLTGVNLVVERGRKVALVGPNGAGKSTLIKLLENQLKPTQGTVTIGANVDMSIFAQHQTDAMDLTRTVVEEFKMVAKERAGQNMRTILGAFGFSGDAGDRLVGDLSGGEQTRLALAKALVNPVNLLVLDEPTNHLDLPSCDLLEDALIAYPGTVLLVTHDRHLIRSVSDALVEVRDGQAVWHEGVEERVLAPAGQMGSRSTASPPTGKKRARRDKKRAQAEERNQKHQDDKALRRSVKKLERQSEKAESQVALLQAELGNPEIYEDPQRAKEMVAAHDAAKSRARALMEAWEEASLALEALDS